MENFDVAKVKVSGEIVPISQEVTSLSYDYSGKKPVIFLIRSYLHKPGYYLTTYFYCKTSKDVFKKFKEGDKIVIYGEIGNEITVEYKKWEPETHVLVECKRIIKVKKQ